MSVWMPVLGRVYPEGEGGPGLEGVLRVVEVDGLVVGAGQEHGVVVPVVPRAHHLVGEVGGGARRMEHLQGGA